MTPAWRRGDCMVAAIMSKRTRAGPRETQDNFKKRENGMETIEATPVGRDLSAETRLTHIVYGLLAASYFTGITALIAVVINYVKIDDVRGTWLESHFRWQIRTFWWGLVWVAIGSVLAIILIGWAVLVAVGVWGIYRIAKGWLNLSERKEMYR